VGILLSLRAEEKEANKYAKRFFPFTVKSIVTELLIGVLSLAKTGIFKIKPYNRLIASFRASLRQETLT
jgi:hypothetical protein